MFFIATSMVLEGIIFMILYKIQPKYHLVKIPRVPMPIFNFAVTVGKYIWVAFPGMEKMTRNKNKNDQKTDLVIYIFFLN